MKKRMMMLLMSLFALTPAILGTALGGENRARHGERQECEQRRAKQMRETIGGADYNPQSKRSSPDSSRPI